MRSRPTIFHVARRSTRFIPLIALFTGGTGALGCAIIAGIDKDYQLSGGGAGGLGVTGSSGMTSSSSGMSSTGTGGMASSSSTTSSTGAGGMMPSSSASAGNGGASSATSSSGVGGAASSSGMGGTVMVCQPASSVPCYTGTPGTEGQGICHGGMKTCNAQGTAYGACVGEVTPIPEQCDTVVDDDCDGTALDPDAGCICLPGAPSSCYSGPAGTEGTGICKAGTTTCNADGKTYGACVGEVVPMPEDCMTPEDDDCDGVAPVCMGGQIWAKHFGDPSSQVGKGVAVQADGTSFLTGYFYGAADFGNGILSSMGGDDVFLAKYDASGTAIWSKRFGDAGNQEGRAVAVDSMGAVAVTGAFTGNLDFGGGPLTGAGSNDIFVAKLDAAGSQVWAKSFGNNSNQYGNDVAVTPSNEIVITGYISGAVDFGGGLLTSAGGTDAFLAKFSPTGAYMWGHLYGNVSNQYGYSVAAQPSGNVILAGNFGGTVDFGAGPLTTAGLNDIFLASIDAAGNGVWNKRFGDGADQFAYAVATDQNGNIALAGSFAGTVDFGGGPLTSAGGNDIYVAMFGPTGTHFWSKRFGDASEQIANSVTFDAQGNVILTGTFAGSVNFGGQALTSAGGNDAFVAKFDAGGLPIWSQRYGDGSDQVAYSAGADAMNNIYVTGSVSGSINFGGGIITSAGVEDVFYAKLFP